MDSVAALLMLAAGFSVVVWFIAMIAVGVPKASRAVAAWEPGSKAVPQPTDSITDMNMFTYQVAKSESAHTRRLMQSEIQTLRNRLTEQLTQYLEQLLVIEDQYVGLSYDIHIGEPKGPVRLYVPNTTAAPVA